ncbi:transporter [Pseudoxanthomonas composti]|uniref:Transporter n=2 Tax=Pseudoxanthomonas composti TaxID=2137479 RepID=A0A4Q1JVX7_9GAMM|nr:transporter [Pseudoxanthomonas composti]RXR06421.1 transporter [Pseudoxanthomonas composti]
MNHAVLSWPSPSRTHRRARALSLAMACALAGVCGHAAAQADAAPICTDRPTKANATCTVPAGTWQIESDLGSYTRDTQPGTRTETFNWVNPTFKYGLTQAMDLQLNWSPQLRVRSTDRSTGQRETLNGAGDVTLRLKARFHEGERVSVAVIPFVKAPTARQGIGNDAWEGGIALPVSVSLPNRFSLTFGPELDLLADSDGSGHHPALVNLVNLAHPLGQRATLAVELWSSINDDPARTIEQASADFALSYLVNPALQLDLGGNFGLNDATPDAQVYLGLSHRF